MELDELLYQKVIKYFKKKKLAAVEQESTTVKLDNIRVTLTIMARTLTGKAIEVYPANREGGYKGENFFLPISINFFDSYKENLSFYYYRIVYLTIQYNIKQNQHYNSVYLVNNKDNIDNKINKLSKQILNIMEDEYPLVLELYNKLKVKYDDIFMHEKNTIDHTWFYGQLMIEEHSKKGFENLENFGLETSNLKDDNIDTIIKAKAVEEIKNIQIDKKSQEDFVLTHNFEKVETAEEFDGIWRDFDGSDELDDHQDALDELNMKFTVRTDEVSKSIYQTDFIENINIAESKEIYDNQFYIGYPEWDYKDKAYKDNFCKIFPKLIESCDFDYYEKVIRENSQILNHLRKMLTNLNNKYTQQKRQIEGEDFDLDSIIDLYSDIYSKKSPTEKIYLSKRKKEKNLSITLLLDTSYSSDSYVDGIRVIDIEKEVCILFGEILNEFNVDFSIATFYSKTRNNVSYDIIKNFEEKWEAAKSRVGAITPQGYTRIGGALRHAGNLLKERQSKNKWVIFLSDGKPNDYDRYEGKYGIFDVKQAIRELSEKNINSYAFAVESQARFYLPQMFGSNQYCILSKSADLLNSLVYLFEKIKYKS